MTVSVWIAFWAGVLSFASPCTLPLVPSYVGYISGVSFHEIAAHRQQVTASIRARAFVHALFFCAGLSFLFLLLGWGATAIGAALAAYKPWIRSFGGLVVIFMGLTMAGVIRWDWLMRDRRIHFTSMGKIGYLGSVVVGVVFAAGWTPCIGPILASVLAITATNTEVGAWYMAAYALGFSIPFLLIALSFTSIRPFVRYTATIQRIGGWLLVAMGALLFTDRMTELVIWLQQVTHYGGV